MKLKAVFFDLDGTLAETENLHLECFNYAFQIMNIRWYWDEKTYSHLLLVGGGIERIIYYSERFTNQVLSKEKAQEIHKIKTACYKEKISKPIPLRTGVCRLLRELKENTIITAVVTTSSRESAEPFLKNSIPSELQFDFVLTGNDVQRKKPHPEIYAKALSYSSISSENVIVIEDSRTGLQSALANRILTIITPSYYTKEENYKEAYTVISHLGEPDIPFEVLENHKLPKNYIDLEVLNYILS